MGLLTALQASHDAGSKSEWGFYIWISRWSLEEFNAICYCIGRTRSWRRGRILTNRITAAHVAQSLMRVGTFAGGCWFSNSKQSFTGLSGLTQMQEKRADSNDVQFATYMHSVTGCKLPAMARQARMIGTIDAISKVGDSWTVTSLKHSGIGQKMIQGLCKGGEDDALLWMIDRRRKGWGWCFA